MVLFSNCGAGRRHDVARAEIPLGIIGDYTPDDERLLDIFEQIITGRPGVELILGGRIGVTPE